MTVNVVGKKSGSFADKGTGEFIEYGRIYVTAPFEKNDYPDAPKVDGVQCLEVKLKPAVIASIRVGSKVNLVYNMHGKVESVEPVA